MHGRILVATSLPGRLAGRQQGARHGAGLNTEPWRHQCPPFSARDVDRLAALSLSCGEQIVVRPARANGTARLLAAALPDPERTRSENRTQTAERRYHRDCVA